MDITSLFVGAILSAVWVSAVFFVGATERPRVRFSLWGLVLVLTWASLLMGVTAVLFRAKR